MLQANLKKYRCQREGPHMEKMNVKLKMMDRICRLYQPFELGVWNAWIFTLYLLSHFLLIRLIDKDIWGKMLPVMDETQKRIIYLSKAIRLFLLVYSFFLPLRVRTMWFYVGFPFCVLGSIMWSVAWANFCNYPLQ